MPRVAPTPACRLPHTDAMWEQVDEGGAQRLIDAIAALPALEHVLLLFGDEEMQMDEWFASIERRLEEARSSLLVNGITQRFPHRVGWPYWPSLGGLQGR